MVSWPIVSCWADISVYLDESLTWCLFGLATCFHLNRYSAQEKQEIDWRDEWPSDASASLARHEEDALVMYGWKCEGGRKVYLFTSQMSGMEQNRTVKAVKDKK